MITSDPGRRTLDINSEAVSHNDVISYFWCCKIDVTCGDVIYLCYVGKFIGANEFAIIKDSDFAVLDMVTFANMNFFNHVFPKCYFYCASFICNCCIQLVLVFPAFIIGCLFSDFIITFTFKSIVS